MTVRMARTIMPRSIGGFTLIELMITVAIIAILASIAYANYTSHVVRSNRADAQQALTQMLQLAERRFTQRNTYGTSAELTAFLAPAAAETRAHGVYTFTASSTGTTFTLRADPVSGTVNEGDGYFTIDHLGAKAWDKNGDGTIQAAENTWKK